MDRPARSLTTTPVTCADAIPQMCSRKSPPPRGFILSPSGIWPLVCRQLPTPGPKRGISTAHAQGVRRPPRRLPGSRSVRLDRPPGPRAGLLAVPLSGRGRSEARPDGSGRASVLLSARSGGDDVERHGGGHVVVEPDRHRVGTEGLDRVGQRDGAAVDLFPGDLGEGAGDLGGGDGAEQAPLAPALTFTSTGAASSLALIWSACSVSRTALEARERWRASTVFSPPRVQRTAAPRGRR